SRTGGTGSQPEELTTTGSRPQQHAPPRRETSRRLSETARRAYEAGKAARLAEQAALEGRSRVVSGVRLALVLGAIALLGAMVWGKPPTALWGVQGVIIAAFVALVLIHPRIESAKAVAGAGVHFHERGLARLDGVWRSAHATPHERGDG